VTRNALGSGEHGIAAGMFPVFVSRVETQLGRETSDVFEKARGAVCLKKGKMAAMNAGAECGLRRRVDFLGDFALSQDEKSVHRRYAC
jgi:hypothetical protein